MRDEKDVNSLLKIIKEEVTGYKLQEFWYLVTWNSASFVEQIKLAQPNLPNQLGPLTKG